MVDEAALLLVVMVRTPVGSIVACRLLVASWALSWFSVETSEPVVPKVMLVAVPPPVAPMVRVLPESGTALAEPILLAAPMPVVPLVAVPDTALTATLELVPVVPDVKTNAPFTVEATLVTPVGSYW